MSTLIFECPSPLKDAYDHSARSLSTRRRISALNGRRPRLISRRAGALRELRGHAGGGRGGAPGGGRHRAHERAADP
jgi:hypothetical protein